MRLMRIGPVGAERPVLLDGHKALDIGGPGRQRQELGAA